MDNTRTKGMQTQTSLKRQPPLSSMEGFPTAGSRHLASSVNHSNPSKIEPGKASLTLEACIDRAFRIPIFLSSTNTLNNIQEKFLNRLILEIENALLFPRTLPVSEQYPETVLTNIRRLVISSYGMFAINFRRYFVKIEKTKVGQPPAATPLWQGSVFSQIEPSMAFQFGLPIFYWLGKRVRTRIAGFGKEELLRLIFSLNGIPTIKPRINFSTAFNGKRSLQIGRQR